jgi:hypothetical protein
MPATKAQLQKEPVRFSTVGIYKVTAYNSGTHVSTCLEYPNLKPNTLHLLLNIVPEVDSYYTIGVEEQYATNPNDSNAVVQKGTVQAKVALVDTLVFFA